MIIIIMTIMIMVIFLISAHVDVWQSDYGWQPRLLQPSTGHHYNESDNIDDKQNIDNYGDDAQSW